MTTIKTSITSIITSNKKRTSFYFPKQMKGSVTLEAAVAIPCFFFAVLCMVYLLEIMAIQLNVRAGMEEASKELSKEIVVIPYLSTGTIEEAVLACIGEEKLERSMVVDGSQGLDCSNSHVSISSGIITLHVRYRVQLPVPTFTHLSLGFEEELRLKGWTGYTVGVFADRDDIVYITDNEAVYHRDYNCSHLQLSIHSVSSSAIETAKNEEGRTYHKCEKCGNHSGLGGNIYITDMGTSYHTSLGCSGLKRSIYGVPLSEVIGKGVCSRCG